MNRIDFLIVGAQKSGTTTLHDILAGIPQVSLPRQKETHFFSHEKIYQNGESWYFEQFSPATVPEAVFGEVDPEYLFHPEAAQRIMKSGYGPKIVFIFRDPLKRAFSQYGMSVRRGIEPLTFEQALLAEEERSRALDVLAYRQGYSYKARSMYFEQVDRFMKAVPGIKCHFMKFEDLVDPDMYVESVNKMLDFLEIDYRLPPGSEIQKSNERALPKSAWINRLIWDKQYAAWPRLLFRRLTTPRFRSWITSLIYGMNISSEKPKASLNLDECQIPDSILLDLKHDAVRLSGLTGLNLADWGIMKRKL